MKPTVSIVLPVRNAERWIGESLASLSSQTCQPDEVVIVDDGSTDRTMSVVSELSHPSFRIVRGGGVGLAAALQVGLLVAGGDLIARLDADDIAVPDRIALQVEAFEDPSLVLCGGWSRRAGARSRRHLFAPPVVDSAIRRFCGLGNPFIHSTVMFRREAALAVGGYRSPSAEAYPEDFDLWLRLLGVGVAANLPRTLVGYRLHADSVSASNRVRLGSSAVELCLDVYSQLLGIAPPNSAEAAILRTYHGVRKATDVFSPLDVHRFLGRLANEGEVLPRGMHVPWTTRARLTRASLRRPSRTASQE